MNACKEDSCFVSLDYKKDMNQSNAEAKINPRRHPDFQYQISRDYVLPDFTSIRRGYLKPADQTGKKPKEDDCTVEQTIRLNNERFAVPELLFSPSDVGISQTGIPEAIGNVQLGINSWRFCTLDGVSRILHCKKFKIRYAAFFLAIFELKLIFSYSGIHFEVWAPSAALVIPKYSINGGQCLPQKHAWTGWKRRQSFGGGHIWRKTQSFYLKWLP